MRRILFVDDEPKVLDGLRRMLRGLRGEWEMEFAAGGPEVLDRLAARSFDVVVTDMRMPGMHGSELLEEMRKQSPTTVRMILSGQCDRQVVLESVGPTHQFLTKPCNSETLKSTVARAFRMRDRLPDEWQRRLVCQVRSIPSLPASYRALVAELESPEASIQRVSDVVSRDLGMTTKILQLVSSSFFGEPQRIADPTHAVGLLGLDTIKSLALSAKAFSPLKIGQVPKHLLKSLVEHSFGVAQTARAITQTETSDPVLISDAFVAGLLHDVGVLVLAEHFPTHYPAIFSTRSQQSPLWEVEEEELHTTHAEIGACVMALWGMPDPIVEAIAYHHRPACCSDRVFSPLVAVRAAHAAEEEKGRGLFGSLRRNDAGRLKSPGCTDTFDPWCANGLGSVQQEVPSSRKRLSASMTSDHRKDCYEAYYAAGR